MDSMRTTLEQLNVQIRASAENMRLGHLLESLKTCKGSSTVVFDFGGLIPSYVNSYRGYYDHLALAWELRGQSECTVAELIARLQEALGKSYQGYKGGNFIMDAQTPMWVAQWGDCTDTAIIGIRDCARRVVIETQFLEL